jgi:hypothetical protein
MTLEEYKQWYESHYNHPPSPTMVEKAMWCMGITRTQAKDLADRLVDLADNLDHGVGLDEDLGFLD